MKSLLTLVVKAIWVGLVILAVSSASPALAATTLTVTSTGDDPNDTTTLRGAITVAASGDTIDLSSVTGTITLTNGQLFISPNLTIEGPGASKLAISGNNLSRVFDIGADAIVAISGLAIENGNADNGGAIRNTGTLTLTSCTISGSSASNPGGGVYNFPGKTLTISDCTLSNNSALFGGGIFNDFGGSVTVTNSTLSNNSALAGGGIFNQVGTLIVTNSTLSGNLAGTAEVLGSGAGIFNFSGTTLVGSASVSNSTLSGNSIVLGPSGGSQGGSALTNFGAMTVTSSTLSSNSGNSGSMWNDDTLVVTNSTFSGNDSVILNQATTNFTSSTLSGNQLGILNAEHGTVTLKNTILANNFPSGNCFNVGTITSQDHNLSDDTTCATFLIQPHDFAPHTFAGLDPDGLKDNGGPTQTIALVPGSPAIDAIDPSSDCSVSTDQRGVSRPQGRFCDIGAFELTPNFSLFPISAITVSVGGSGSSTVTVNSIVGFSSAVTLTVSGASSGFATSFTINPVTPPSYGSAASTLNVTLGPAVTAGSYTLIVTGIAAGPLTHSTPVNVTVTATSGGTSTLIGTLQALGCINNSGISNALLSKLAAAQADIDGGRIQAAIDTLTALLNQLQAQAGKHVGTSCTVNGVTFDPVQVLIADVEALLMSL